MDAKTITVSVKTHKELEELKQDTNASSYDQLLSTLARERLGVKKSMFGAAKGLRTGFVRDRKDRV